MPLFRRSHSQRLPIFSEIDRRFPTNPILRPLELSAVAAFGSAFGAAREMWLSAPGATRFDSPMNFGLVSELLAAILNVIQRFLILKEDDPLRAELEAFLVHRMLLAKMEAEMMEAKGVSTFGRDSFWRELLPLALTDYDDAVVYYMGCSEVMVANPYNESGVLNRLAMRTSRNMAIANRPELVMLLFTGFVKAIAESHLKGQTESVVANLQQRLR